MNCLSPSILSADYSILGEQLKQLDEAGFRGKLLGGMCFSEIHANFLVNEGKGSADAALELIRSAQSAVWERFGIQLQTEVKLWVF